MIFARRKFDKDHIYRVSWMLSCDLVLRTKREIPRVRNSGWKDGDPGNQVVWRNGKRRHIVTCYQQRRQSGTDASIAAFTAAAHSTSPQWGTSPFTRRAKKSLTPSDSPLGGSYLSSCCCFYVLLYA